MNKKKGESYSKKNLNVLLDKLCYFQYNNSSLLNQSLILTLLYQEIYVYYMRIGTITRSVTDSISYRGRI